MKFTEKARCLAAAFLVCGGIYLNAHSGSYRVCYFGGGCQESDSGPANLTVYNACELIAGNETLDITGNVATCGWTENQTQELTIEILD